VTTSPPTSLEDLARDPGRAAELAPEAVPALLAQAGAVVAVLAARLAEGRGNGNGAEQVPNGEDRLLTAGETADRLGTTRDYVYRNAKRFPFTVRLSPQQLRFSLRGIEKFQRQRQGI